MKRYKRIISILAAGAMLIPFSAAVTAGSTNILKNQLAGIAEVLEADPEPASSVTQESGEEVIPEEEKSQEAKPEERSAQKWGYDNLGIAKVDNHLNIRETPGEDGKLIGKMSKNTACEILEIKDNWAKVKSGKVTGYVSMDFLYTGEEAIDKGEEVAYMTATVTTQTLKVREKPGLDSIVLTLIPYAEELEVEKVLDGWVEILVDDEVAYVSADYVKVEEKLGTAVTLTELLYGDGVSNLRVDLVQFAKKHVGNPYVWGGTSLTKGADCSGFVQSVYKKFGIAMPRTSREQANKGKKIKASEAQPGDLFFYAKNGTVNHVAIYIGNGQVVHASSKRTGIKISGSHYRTPFSVRRVLP